MFSLLVHRNSDFRNSAVSADFYAQPLQGNSIRLRARVSDETLTLSTWAVPVNVDLPAAPTRPVPEMLFLFVRPLGFRPSALQLSASRAKT